MTAPSEAEAEDALDIGGDDDAQPGSHAAFCALISALANPLGSSNILELWGAATYYAGLNGIAMRPEAFIQYARARAEVVTRRKISDETALLDEVRRANKSELEARAERDKFAEECRTLDAELHTLRKRLEAGC